MTNLYGNTDLFIMKLKNKEDYNKKMERRGITLKPKYRRTQKTNLKKLRG